LPESRILRPEFLETILLKDKYRHALTRLGVRIIGARFMQTVDLETAELEHDLWLKRSLLEKGANFRSLKSTNVVLLDGSKVTGALDMNGLRVDQSLLMRDKAEFGEVGLGSAHISGSVDLSGSKVTGKLEMAELNVEKGLFMRDEAEFGEVDLLAAHIGGSVDLSGSAFTDKLDMNGLQVDQNLFMSDKAEFAEVDLIAARIGGQVDLSSSKVTGTIEMDELQARSEVFLGGGAEFEGPIHFVFGKLGSNLELAGGTFKNNVDLTGTRIGGELRLGSSRHGSARWSGESALILRNATADAIQDLSDSWPGKIDLNGFNYRSLGGIFGGEKDPMIDRPIEWFKKSWLEKQEPYTPAPYEQLATVLHNAGKPEVADGILYTGKEQERAQSRPLSYVGLTASKWVIGYGHHLFWSIYWALGFLITGALVLWLSNEGRRISRHYNILYGIAYSFDLLLPIIRLREKHYQIDLHGWVRYYFFVHRIMGYVLASFLIAGISGLTK
jgi:hypothetical protein